MSTNLYIPPNSLIRIKNPLGTLKSFKLQYRDPATLKWVDYKTEAVATINRRLQAKEINLEQAKERMKQERALMYIERDKHLKVVACCEYNLKLLSTYLEARYPDRVRLRMKEGSYTAMVNYFKQALSYVPSTPLDTEITQLQDALDGAVKTTHNSDGSKKIEKLSSNKSKHRKMVEFLNRLLGFLGRTDKLLPFPNIHNEVDYITENQFQKVIENVSNPTYKALIGLIYWTGMRFGETLPLTEKDLLGDRLKVYRQIDRKRVERLPKNDKTRIVFLDQQAQKYLKDWLAIPVADRLTMAKNSSRPVKALKQAAKLVGVENADTINLITLRHSRAIYLASNNIQIDLIAKNLGHSRAVCEKHYAGFVMTTDDETLMRLRLAEIEKLKGA
tara:strand:+ start:267 stop:1433 length:1167 start_codon:yes stop_codon:yes gene_type:complete